LSLAGYTSVQRPPPNGCRNATATFEFEQALRKVKASRGTLQRLRESHLWYPSVASLAARPSLVVRIMRRNGYLINEARTQSLDGSSRGEIVRVAGDRASVINGTDERRDGTASRKRIAMTPKWLKNLEPNVPGANSDVFGIANPEIDVPNIRTIRK